MVARLYNESLRLIDTKSNERWMLRMFKESQTAENCEFVWLYRKGISEIIQMILF
jgi:hypothetical protein